MNNGGFKMFDEIDELIKEIEKFKSNIVGSNELFSLLEKVYIELGQLEKSNKEIQTKTYNLFNELSERLYQLEAKNKENISKLVEENYKIVSVTIRKFNNILIAMAIIAILIIVFKFL